jgi:hypothetical protein
MAWRIKNAEGDSGDTSAGVAYLGLWSKSCRRLRLDHEKGS